MYVPFINLVIKLNILFLVMVCVCVCVCTCVRACVRVCVYMKIQPSVLQKPLTVDLYMSCNLIYILILMKRFYEMSLLGEPLANDYIT